jgi:hypothetical protein
MRTSALSTSLDSIQIQPRTPRTPRDMRHDQATPSPLRAGAGADGDEVEMRLLDVPADGFEVEKEPPAHSGHISGEDRRAMVLLCVLCACRSASRSVRH